MNNFNKLVLLVVQGWFLQSGVSGQTITHYIFMSGLGGDCSITQSGCTCKDRCINPRNGSRRSKLPWCEVVEDSCMSIRPRFVINTDFCLPGCDYIKEEEKKEIEKVAQKETVSGCKCATKWYYRNKEYQNCANPDNDPRGSWCAVDQDSCPLTLYFGIFKDGFLFGYQRNVIDYCLQKEPSASRSHTVSPPSPLPNISLPVTPPTLNTQDFYFSPVPRSPIQSPSPNFTPEPTPGPTPASLPLIDAPKIAQVEGCQSLLTILNETMDFSTFNEVLMETGFDQDVQALSNQTIFVPDDEAWQKFADNQKIDVGDFFLFQSNIEALREIAELHFVTELLNEQVLFNTTEKVVQTQLTGQSLTISSEKGQIFIEPPNADAGSSQTIDIPGEVCEGQFFRVDTVLTPQIVV